MEEQKKMTKKSKTIVKYSENFFRLLQTQNFGTTAIPHQNNMIRNKNPIGPKIGVG